MVMIKGYGRECKDTECNAILSAMQEQGEGRTNKENERDKG
jgi:pentatricopeptide repeat protein